MTVVPVHHWVGLQLTNGLRIQAYVIRPEGVGLEDVFDRVWEEAEHDAEETHAKVIPILGWVHHLSNEIAAIIQSELACTDPEVSKMLAEADQYHVTIWTCGPDHRTYNLASLCGSENPAEKGSGSIH